MSPSLPGTSLLWHLLSAFVNRVFPSTVTSSLPFSLGPTRSGCVAISAQCSAASKTPRYHLPAFLPAMVQAPVSTPIPNLECSVDPLVASNDLRPSSRHLCQLFGCPRGLRPAPPVIFPSIIRLRNRPSFCRATTPEKKSRRLRNFVLTLSHRVFLTAFVNERAV